MRSGFFSTPARNILQEVFMNTAQVTRVESATAGTEPQQPRKSMGDRRWRDRLIIRNAGALMSALAFASLAWLNTAWSADHGIVCQDCASAELASCALVTAMQLGLSHNDRVWVLDLNNLN